MSDNNNNTTPLSGSEYRRVGALIYDKIANYANLPNGCEVDYQGINGINHIGFLTAPGGKLLRKFVTGGFEAQLPFQILYKTMPTDNNLSYEAQNLVDDLADWLETKPYPDLTDDRVVTSIIMDSTTYRSEAQDDGSIVFVRNGNVVYEKG